MTARKAKAGTPISTAIATALALAPKDVPGGGATVAPAPAVVEAPVDPPSAAAGPAGDRFVVGSGGPTRPSSAFRSPQDPAMELSPYNTDRAAPSTLTRIVRQGHRRTRTYRPAR